MSIKLWINNLPQEVKFFSFSGGERQVVIDKTYIPIAPNIVHIEAFVKSTEVLVDLLLLEDAISRLGHKLSQKTLYLPYVPYARQDRVMNRGEALSLQRFSKILEVMNFDSIEVDDAHSDVTTAVILNVKENKQHTLVYKALSETIRDGNFLLVSPDAGALKKTQALANAMNLESPVIAFKTRDTKNGGISDTGFYGDVKGRNVLIVDDILDGGWTFIKLGEQLKKAGAEKVILWVTHGIFSKGVDVLEGAIDEVYSKNIWWENVAGRNLLNILKTSK